MKSARHATLKKQEALRRMVITRTAQRNAGAARRVQRRASLVGAGTKWRITNLRQVARAMAAWV